MLFWIAVAVLTALVAVLFLLPLMRRAPAGVDDAPHDSAVYRDQMAEVDRDLDNGLIGPEEAANARAEIGRRLLQAESQRAVATTAGRRSRLIEMAALALIPAVGLSVYLTLGRPEMPAQPLAARLENPGDDLNLLVAKAERHLADKPDDGAGWDTLAPIYYRNQRFPEAESAYRNAIRLLGPTPERLGALGEAMLAQSQGIVTEDARTVFAEVLTIDPADARAAFYLALALEQAGKRDEAKAAFEALAKRSAPDAPWQPIVAEHIAMLSAPPAAAGAAAPDNPTAADIEAASGMAAGDRQQMILGMVASLEEKLKAEPKNIAGWLRLVRSLTVLGETERAKAALATALATFPPETDEGKQLTALAAETGLAGNGAD